MQPIPPAPIRKSALNESPSEKEGKSQRDGSTEFTRAPSMKVPPKRKGNPHERRCSGQ